MRWKQKNGSDAVKGPGMIQGLSLDLAPGVAEGLDLIPSAWYDLTLSAGLDPYPERELGSIRNVRS